MILAIDIGNTFTDFILIDGTQWHTLKLFSAAHETEKCILKGFEALNVQSPEELSMLGVIHNGGHTVNSTLLSLGIKTIPIDAHTSTIPYFLSHLCTHPSLININMGGTKTELDFLKNGISLKNITLSLGGESIAYIDNQQLLQVGSPSTHNHAQSSCYNFGDSQPTITDANLILGRIRPEVVLGNMLRPDANAARMAISVLAGLLNTSIERIALSIVQKTNQMIIDGVHDLLDEKPGSTLLCATGACSGLHICAIADALNIKDVIVPVMNGVFSALNLLAYHHASLSLTKLSYKKARASHQRTQLYGISLPVSVWQRQELSPEEMIMGPAIIVEQDTSTFLQNGWLAYVDEVGNLLLRRMAIDTY